MEKIKFDFNDILISPSVSTDIISSYSEIKTNIIEDICGFTDPNKKLPIMAAPMDTVTDLNNFLKFINCGIPVFLPRTVSITEYNNYFSKYNISSSDFDVIFSLGLNQIKEKMHHSFNEFSNGSRILIDIANGHISELFTICDDIYKIRPDIKLFVGNIANPNTYVEFSKKPNVIGVRVGIGNGSGCLTTKQTGVGYPMGSLISEMYEIKKTLYNLGRTKLPLIIADGGFKDYSDIIKGLCLGADYIMLGGILNKAIESSGDNYLGRIKVSKTVAKWLFSHGFTIYKSFRGMSTKEAQKAMGNDTIKTSEGVVRMRKVEYSLDGWVKNFDHYLRRAMSYTNSKDLFSFIGSKQIIFISGQSYDRFNK